MDAPAFDARFVRSALRTIAQLLIIVISMMALMESAHAEGTVTRSTSVQLWCSQNNDPATCTYPTKEEACTVRAQAYYSFYHLTYQKIIVEYTSGWFTGWNCEALNAAGTQWDWFGFIDTAGACPANSNSLDRNSCICNAGYHPDTAGTSCVQVNLTITLSGKNTMQPAALLPFNAVVTDQNGLVQQGKQVVISVNVQDGTGGHIHTENRPKGILSCDTSFGASAGTCTLTTDYSGQAAFNFIATPISGTHTITATCEGCGNTATASVNVKVDNLIPIPSSPLYALEDSAHNVIGAIPGKHTDNHYLTRTAITKLKQLAAIYITVNPGAKLYLNDASLVWGGLFDVGGTPWQSPHSLHDTGVSLDIRAANSGPNTEGAIPATLFDSFLKEAKKRGLEMGLHCKNSSDTNYCLGQPNNRHFHVDF